MDADSLFQELQAAARYLELDRKHADEITWQERRLLKFLQNPPAFTPFDAFSNRCFGRALLEATYCLGTSQPQTYELNYDQWRIEQVRRRTRDFIANNSFDYSTRTPERKNAYREAYNAGKAA